MAALAIILLAAMATGGCTANIRNTDINFEAGRDMKVDASGASNLTDTAQTADGDFSGLIEAVKSWADKNVTDIVGVLKDGSDVVEETIAEPEALEDLTDQGNVVEVE